MASTASGSVSIGAWPTPGTSTRCSSRRHAAASDRQCPPISRRTAAPRISRVGRLRASRRNSSPASHRRRSGTAACRAEPRSPGHNRAPDPSVAGGMSAGRTRCQSSSPKSGKATHWSGAHSRRRRPNRGFRPFCRHSRGSGQCLPGRSLGPTSLRMAAAIAFGRIAIRVMVMSPPIDVPRKTAHGISSSAIISTTSRA